MLDETNIAIINMLREDARSSYIAIAKKLNLSESAIRKRVGTLEEQGVIKKYAAVIEPAKLGYENVAFIGVDVEPTSYLDVARKLRDNSSLKCVSTSLGDHMFMLEVWAKNNDELHTISEGIKQIEGVTRICPAVIKETLKGHYH